MPSWRLKSLDGEFLTLHDAPWVKPPPHPLTSRLDHGVAADHCKRRALLHHTTPEPPLQTVIYMKKLYDYYQRTCCFLCLYFMNIGAKKEDKKLNRMNSLCDGDLRPEFLPRVAVKTC